MKKLLISIGLTLLLTSPAYANNSSGGILEECGLWTSFQAEKAINDKASCEEAITQQAENKSPTRSHALFNPNGQGSINGTNGCCYSNQNDKNFDNNNNCQLDEGSETCQLELRALAIKKACICNEDPDNEICYQVFRCEFGENTPTTYTAYESEFFDVTSPTKGLYADGQEGAFVAENNSQGPIFTIVNRVVNIMVGLASTVALVVLIIGAYLLITAQGGENQMERGKNAIMYALLGLVFILTSYTIVRLVQSILF